MTDEPKLWVEDDSDDEDNGAAWYSFQELADPDSVARLEMWLQHATQVPPTDQ